MKKSNLSRNEAQIENRFEEYKPVSQETRKRIEKLIEEGRKSRAISLRINEKDLKRLKEKAKRNGLPYQTMINVVIHKYVNDTYLDKDELDKFLKLKKAA